MNRDRTARPPRRRRFVRAAAALAVAGCGVLAPAPAHAARGGEIAFRMGDSRITESSGLAVSVRHPGITYTHNDSGGVAQLFAVDGQGRTRAVLTLAGAGARDWEAMALGKDERGRPAIYVADIGDNLGGAWPYVTVYRIPEPAALENRTVRATAFRLRYADGPRNAETMMINPRTNRLYVASKLFGGAVYEAPATLRAGSANTLRKVGDAPAMATDGAFSPDGRTCVIRTYFNATLYSVDGNGRPGKALETLDLPMQKQGESIAYAADGRSLLVGSEGSNQPVYEVPLPQEARPSPSSPAGKAADDAPERRDAGGTRAGLFLALAIAGAVGYGLMRRRGS